MRNLSREALVVHQQNINVLDVGNEELLQAIRKKVASLDARGLALESSTVDRCIVTHLLIAAITNLQIS